MDWPWMVFGADGYIFFAITCGLFALRPHTIRARVRAVALLTAIAWVIQVAIMVPA